MAEWHAEARRLRAEGLSVRVIAARVGASRSAVHEAVTPRRCPECNGLAHSTSALCRACYREAEAERRDARRQRIAALWHEGKTLVGIAAALGTTPGAVKVAMVNMRKDGWDLPYRRIPRLPAA
jgi:hypothetical protein